MKRKPPQVVQAELSVALYGALRKGGGTIQTARLAARLGVVESTVSRQSIGDLPVQAQTIKAVCDLDPDAGLRLLRILAHACGYDIVPLASDGAARDLLDTLESCGDSGAELARRIVHVLRDGRVDPAERADLVRLLPPAIRALQLALARLEGTP